MPIRFPGGCGHLGETWRVVRFSRATREVGGFRDPGRAPTRIPIGDTAFVPGTRSALTVPEPSSRQPAAWCHGG